MSRMAMEARSPPGLGNAARDPGRGRKVAVFHTVVRLVFIDDTLSPMNDTDRRHLTGAPGDDEEPLAQNASAFP
jgi:hypothetical protein